MEYLSFFFTSFVALFVIIDPLGTVGVYLALTNNIPRTEARKIARKACIIAFFILTIFGLFGLWLLQGLGISTSAFKVTGGLLLFVTAFRMVMGYNDPEQSNSKKSHKDYTSLAVFPMAIPMLAGPGCMTTCLLLMTQDPDFFSLNKLIVIGTVILVLAISYICLVSSKKIMTYLGETGSLILAHVMGILLAALSIQFIADGVFEFINTNLTLSGV